MTSTLPLGALLGGPVVTTCQHLLVPMAQELAMRFLVVLGFKTGSKTTKSL